MRKTVIIGLVVLLMLLAVPAALAQTEEPWTGGSDAMGVNQVSKVWYFAEGYTGPGFEEWLCLQNPHSSDVIATIIYMLGDGSLREQGLTLLKQSRTTIFVNGFVGVDQNISAKVEAEEPIIAERPMYFNYQGKWTGGHDVMGATAPNTEWYFAEGTTREGFEEWLCLMNPGEQPATVMASFIGTTNKEQEILVPPHTRQTVDVNALVGPGQDISCKLISSKPIVAERPMYFDYNGWTGGSDTIGAKNPAKTWYFAEGTTRSNFVTYLCLQNIGPATTATLDYMIEGQGLQPVSVDLPASSRSTFLVSDHIGFEKDFSVEVKASQNIVAERPMYFNYKGIWTGGHDVMGVNAPNTDWYFAEGTTRMGSNQFDEWLCLQNPNPSDMTVSATYMLGPGQGGPITKVYGIPAQQRLTVSVNEEVGTEKDVSVHLTSSSGFVAERPMYFSYIPIGSGAIYWPGKDKTPPVTDEILDPAVAGWTNQSVKVTLVAHDYESGVQRSYLSTDGGLIFSIYSGPIRLMNSGTYSLKYYSTDNVGNIEAIKDGMTVRIDKIKPQVANLTVLTHTAKSASLTWSGSDAGGSGVSFYKVFRNGAFIAQVTENHYTVTGLTPRQSYQFEVAAIDGAGNESNKVVVNVTMEDLPAPLGLQLVGQPYSIEASWQQPSSEVTSYHVWLSDNGTNFADRGVVSTTSTVLSGLNPVTTYWVRVYSRDVDGNESLGFIESSILTPPDI